MSGVDWEAIKNGYENAVSLRQLAALYGNGGGVCSPATIHRRAKEEGWVRGSAPTMREAVAETIETAQIQELALANARIDQPNVKVEDLTPESLIQHAAMRTVDILRSQKTSVAMARLAIDDMSILLLRQLALTKKKAGQKLRKREEQELSFLVGMLGAPHTQLRSLTLALQKAVPLERLVHVIATDAKEGGSIADKTTRQRQQDIGDILHGLTPAVPGENEAIH